MKKVSMKKMFYFFATMGVVFVMTTTGCKKNQESIADSPTNTSVLGDVSLDNVIKDLKTIKGLGFDPTSAKIVADGYIVEGDIHLTRKSLDASFATQSARQEQYSTQFKIATSGLRTINVALTNSANAGNLNVAFNNTVTDLNNLKLPSLKFVRVTNLSTAEITVAFNDLGPADKNGNVTLGKDGSFVNPNGNPGSDISLNSNPDAGIASSSVSFLQSVLVHEFGHAIGLRHTDYQDRLYGQLKSGGSNPTSAAQDAALTRLTKQLVDDSNGAGTWNRQSAASKASLKAQVFAAYFDEGEGSSDDFSLATHIYGTPLTPTYTNNTFTTATDPLSIMISYANSTNLTFSAYDTIALLGLYGNSNQLALIRSYLTSTGTVTAAANAKGITTVAQVVAAVKALG